MILSGDDVIEYMRMRWVNAHHIRGRGLTTQRTRTYVRALWNWTVYIDSEAPSSGLNVEMQLRTALASTDVKKVKQLLFVGEEREKNRSEGGIEPLRR